MKKALIRAILKLTGWKHEGKHPGVERCVMVAYPHTSNWDLPLLLAYAQLEDVPLRFLIKAEVMKGLAGKVLGALGGIAVDRSKRNNLVDAAADILRSTDKIVLCVPPEGTRKKVDYWRSGFYHMARAAGVPVFLSWVDGPRKAFGTGPLVELTGDVESDLQKMRDYYAPIKGFHPERASPIRFKPQAPDPSNEGARPPQSPVLGEEPPSGSS